MKNALHSNYLCMDSVEIYMALKLHGNLFLETSHPLFFFVCFQRSRFFVSLVCHAVQAYSVIGTKANS